MLLSAGCCKSIRHYSNVSPWGGVGVFSAKGPPSLGYELNFQNLAQWVSMPNRTKTDVFFFHGCFPHEIELAPQRNKNF